LKRSRAREHGFEPEGREAYMTIKEFLVDLEKTADAFRWECLEGGAVRAMLKAGTTRTSFDPLTATLFFKNQQDPVDSDRVRAGEQLGLSNIDCRAIRDAADGSLWTWVEGSMVLDGYAEWLREGMSLAINLELTDGRQMSPESAMTRIPPAGIPLEPEAQLQHF